MLNLAGNRGAIDCGGFEFMLIRYGAFFQYVRPIAGGHVSVAIELTADPLAVTQSIDALLVERGLLFSRQSR